MSFFTCPVCGGEVDSKEKRCPHCGADEETGWGDTHMDGVETFDEEDYQDTLRKEFGEDAADPKKKSKKGIIITVTAVVVLVVWILSYFV